MTPTASAPRWRRSSRCASAACVEVDDTGDDVQVRDAAATVVTFDRDAWASFITGIRTGGTPAT